MTYGSLRAQALVMLPNIMPVRPTIYGVYNMIKSALGTYDYKTMLADVRHAVNFARTEVGSQAYPQDKYLPKRLLVETDRLTRANYKIIYRVEYYDEKRGVGYKRWGSIYSNYQMTAADIHAQRGLEGFVGITTWDEPMIKVTRTSVWHQRGAPYAAGPAFPEI